MAVTFERHGPTLIAVANGRVDSNNASDFQAELNAAIDGVDPEGGSVVLDLGGLSYISSAGLRVILLVAKTLQGRNSRFAVCSPSDPIREIFEISGFNQIIPVHDGRGDALDAFNG